MIGREDAVATLVARLSRQRLVTIVGAWRHRQDHGRPRRRRAHDRAPMSTASGWSIWRRSRDPRLVPSAVATVLGLEIRTEDPLPGLVAALRDKRMLLLLDNCEHVIDAAAGLAAAVLSGAPGVNILATSREPLGVAGERVVPPRTAQQPGAVVYD